LTNLWAILLAQAARPLVLILAVASLVGRSVTAGITLRIIVMRAALAFVQEARSETAMAALMARLTLRATVAREGQRHEVPIHDVVRGDLVVLDAGDIVPTDVSLIEAPLHRRGLADAESAPPPKLPRPAGATRLGSGDVTAWGSSLPAWSAAPHGVGYRDRAD